MKVWLNGEIVDERKAHISPLDRGFTLGDGLFETVLARSGHACFLDSHIVRLAAGASLLGIPLPQTARHLAVACAMLLDANDLIEAPRAALRITLTRGPGPRGLIPPEKPKPTLLISVASTPTPPAAQTAIVAMPRRNALSPVSRLKALPYLDNFLAREEARARGADEALILDTSGYLSCASVANVFLWEGDRLVTPSEQCAILPGIARACVLELAARLKIGISEERILPERLAKANGAFLTNSLNGIVPLTQIDGKPVTQHRLTGRLQAAYEMLLDADDSETGSEDQLM